MRRERNVKGSGRGREVEGEEEKEEKGKCEVRDVCKGEE